MLMPQTPLSLQEAKLKNPLALAFLGDTVWDLFTRRRLLESRLQVNALHRRAVAQVNAGAQALAAARVEGLLTPEETEIFRARLQCPCPPQHAQKPGSRCLQPRHGP